MWASHQASGVLDVEDITWKNYLDSLACTECGRCTEVCPAGIVTDRERRGLHRLFLMVLQEVEHGFGIREQNARKLNSSALTSGEGL